MGSCSKSSDLAAFRDRVHHFLNVTQPTVLATGEDPVARGRAWRRALYDAGLAGLDVACANGGQGSSDEMIAIWNDESRGRLPSDNSVFHIGLSMVVPLIGEYGTEELRRRFIPPALAGEEIWCQLYSEPGAGSDLAALSTRAVRDGDEWVVSGQKVWTSGAQHSQLAVLLARTNPDVPKHRGITMFILPMEQPGVEVRPLRQMTGHAEFNEVFLDEARIPADWVIGEVDGGWAVAVALLAHERVLTGVASMQNAGTERQWGRVPIPVVQLIELARQRDRLGDATVRQTLAELWSNERLVGWLGEMGVHPSIGKLWRTRQGRAAADLAARLEFSGSAAWEPGDEDAEFFAFQILNCRGMSMGGGTDEIQRNTLGERVLGLPGEPSLDRGVPFRDIPRSSVHGMVRGVE